MSDWKIFYRDEHSRDAQTSHPSKGAATSQAVHLVLHQKCRIHKIEGPNGEVIDRETFEETGNFSGVKPRAHGDAGSASRTQWRAPRSIAGRVS